MRRAILAIWLSLPTLAQSPSPAGAAISLDEVVRLTKAGVGEELVITKIKKGGRAFDLSTEEILELKRSGVGDNVIRFLMDPSQPYTPPPPSIARTPPVAPAASATDPQKAPQKAKDPLVSAVPSDAGVYYRANGVEEFSRLELKPVTAAKAGGKAVELFTAGLKKANVIGYLVGPAAQLEVSDPSAGFVLRLPEKTVIEDIILIAVARKEDRREMSFGPDAAKPAFTPGAVLQYQSKEVDKGLYRIQPSRMKSGEYLFMILGSGEEKKGILAKGWEFRVSASK